jgi:hypothetical protein
MKTISMLIVSVLFAACAQQDPYDASETDDNDVNKADSAAVHPAGRFAGDWQSWQNNASQLQAGMFTELTLNADKTFGGHEFTYCNVAATGDEFTHCGLFRGTYKFTKSGSNKYIRFYDTDGTFIGRFQYKFTASTGALKMKPLSTSGGTYTTITGIDGDTFVADAKDAYLNTPSDQTYTTPADAAPQAAADAFNQIESAYHPTLVRIDVDGMSVYAVHSFVTDASWTSLFDETGLIASGSSDFRGQFNWDSN